TRHPALAGWATVCRPFGAKTNCPAPGDCNTAGLLLGRTPVTAAFAFTLPPELAAKEPPERRGLARDGVRLLVLDRRTHRVEHARFRNIGDFLRPGDLLVFNASRTLPAALPGRVTDGGPAVEVRLAERLPDDSWLALVVCGGGEPFGCGLRAGLEVTFGLGLTATVLDRDRRIPRLWRVRFSKTGAELIDLVHRP